jgi:hypothetical protein
MAIPTKQMFATMKFAVIDRYLHSETPSRYRFMGAILVQEVDSLTNSRPNALSAQEKLCG